MRDIRNRRTRVIAGAVGLTIAITSLSLAASGAASATNIGQQPGALALSPAKGGPHVTPSWIANTACPAAFSAAGAGIAVFDLTGNFIESATGQVAPSAVTSPGFGSASAGNGGFAANMGLIASIGQFDSSTVEFVVDCVSSLGPVTFFPEMSTFVTFDAHGNWTTSATQPVQITTTTLSPSANPAVVDQPVTLTAVETAPHGSVPTGTMQFMEGKTKLGAPVPLDANGQASKPITFLTAKPSSEQLSAVFTPTDVTKFTPSTGKLTLAIKSNQGHGH
jgi:Bacterial Ig-like domain (group 3)